MELITPELEKKLYHDGIALFNDHEFFEAHEVWEDIWHAAYGIKHDFYQGMIQCSVSLEHYRRRNPAGVTSLFASYKKKFRDVPPVFMGLNVTEFLEAMRKTLSPVIDAHPMPTKGSIELDPTTVTKIQLIYDPFETGEAQKYAKPAKF